MNQRLLKDDAKRALLKFNLEDGIIKMEDFMKLRNRNRLRLRDINTIPNNMEKST